MACWRGSNHVKSKIVRVQDEIVTRPQVFTLVSQLLYVQLMDVPAKQRHHYPSGFISGQTGTTIYQS